MKRRPTQSRPRVMAILRSLAREVPRSTGDGQRSKPGPAAFAHGARWSEPGVLMALAWVAVMTFLQVVRQPGVPSWDSIWQEDGTVFLSDALANPFFVALSDPYNAYLHVVPRIIAGVAAPIPLDYSAVVLSVGSALVVAVLSVYVYFASASVFSSPWTRVTLAGLFVLLPATAYETNANIANLHWYLLFACFWVFMVDSESRGWVVTGAAIVLATVLSDPLTGLFLPLAAVRAVRTRTWRGRVVPLLFFAALAVQLVLGASEQSPEPYAPSEVTDLPGIFALRVTGSLLVGDRFLDELWRRFGYWFAFGSLAVVVLALGYGFTKTRAVPRLHLTLSAVYSVLFLSVPLMLRGTAEFLNRENFNLNGSRYTVVPILFLVVAVLLVLEKADTPLREATWIGLRRLFLVVTFTLVVVNYSNFAVRTAGPEWRANLAAARSACASGGPTPIELRLDGLGGEAVERARENRSQVAIRIAPNIEPPPWAVLTTCRRLR
jgi:hypothetical protein